MAKFEEEAARLNIKSIIITMILAAFGFLVAFAWRDAIKQTIDLLIPAGQGLLYTYLAAIMVTVIAVIATFILIRLERANIIPDKYEERLKKKLKRK